jgi:excisionase family DNA binding protein
VPMPQRTPAPVAYAPRPSARPASFGTQPAARPVPAGFRPQPRPGQLVQRPLGVQPAPRPAPVRFLTVAEVAGIMRVSKMTVYRLVHTGELAAVRVGRSFRVPEAAVRDYLSDARTDVA